MLGLEIRKPLAEKNREEAVGVDNLGFISCNANVDLSRILSGVNEFSKVGAWVGGRLQDKTATTA